MPPSPQQTFDSKSSPSQIKATLTWRQTIDWEPLGISPKSKAVGQTIEDIVASRNGGRDDGLLCNACHNKDHADGGYGLDVPANVRGRFLDPVAVVGTKGKRAWAGQSGWAERFIRNKTKPTSLKKVMKAWADGGFQ